MDNYEVIERGDLMGMYYYFTCQDPNPTYCCGTKQVICDQEGMIIFENTVETYYEDWMNLP